MIYKTLGYIQKLITNQNCYKLRVGENSLIQGNFRVRHIYWVFFVHAFPLWCHLWWVCWNSSISEEVIRWQASNLPLQTSDVLTCCIIKCCITEVTSNPLYIHDSHLPVICISQSDHLLPNHQCIQDAESSILPRNPKPINHNVLTKSGTSWWLSAAGTGALRWVHHIQNALERWCTGRFEVDWVHIWTLHIQCWDIHWDAWARWWDCR